MRGKHKLISGILAFTLFIGAVLPTQATDLKNQADSLQSQIDQAATEKQQLTNKVKEITSSMKETETQLEAKQTEIEAAEQELIMAKLDENIQYESMKQRIKFMYENGNTNYIELFIESSSISDFLVKAEYIMKLSEYDRDKLKEYQRIIRSVEEKELQLEAEYDTLASLRTSLDAKRKEAEALLAEKATELSSMQAELAEVKAQIAKAEEEERRRKEAEEARRKEEERRRKEEEEKKKQEANKNQSSTSSSNTTKPPVVSGNGYFTHPCPGMNYQSSYFGEVRYSIGDPIPHKGHDYAAAKGTPIYAAAAGKVLIAGYSSSAGYWVVIDHGNGLTTKYMHMFESPYVSAGQTVVKGQHIGGVGTTGMSTGNHLHFQVEEWGTPVNPSKYL